MSELYPLLLVCKFDERPWGVRDLSPVYTRVVKEPIGESWLTWHDNIIANGPLSGQTLGDVARHYRRQLVGTEAVLDDQFPLLVKFLFTAEKLSVQVHPDDEQARRVGQLCGKTECWYVLNAKPEARVALGLAPGVTTEQFRQAIQANAAEHLLNWVPVREGDMIFVDAGTVHTIGGGLVLVETQQSSDITYRLYDYGRPRELHVDQGLAAVKLHTGAGKVVRSSGSSSNLLVRSKYFQVEKMNIRQPLHAEMTPASPQILVATEGAGVVESHGMEPISFAKGEAVVIPAATSQYGVRPQWDLDLMRMSVPEGDVPAPETVLEHGATIG